MKVGVIGSRSFNDYELLKEKLNLFHSEIPITLIVSGGAKGADRLGVKWAMENKIEKHVFYPNWDKYGKGAGFIRNQSIVDWSDVIIAFWDGKSRGTNDSINKARLQNKEVFIIRF